MGTLIKLLALGALLAAVGAGIALASIGGSDTSSPTLSPLVSPAPERSAVQERQGRPS
jgi:hypothetical protein